MSRIPALSREEMDVEQQKVYDATLATTGRVGRGPSVGYAYSPGLWRVHNASSAHLTSSVDYHLVTRASNSSQFSGSRSPRQATC
jgi:hypothetical protein